MAAEREVAVGAAGLVVVVAETEACSHKKGIDALYQNAYKVQPINAHMTPFCD